MKQADDDDTRRTQER
jgi:hypothetical protein